jgi:CDP-diacylglycerol pyrophosphatase
MRPGWLVALLLISISAQAADPSALWQIVNGECVPHEQSQHIPSPCAEVDIKDGVGKGFAVLKDIRGIAQYLLIPTARIGGIEDPAILQPNATNYWEAAWQARKFVDEKLNTTLPRDAVSLAINSMYGRTQNQLHIHVDCVSPEVHRTLSTNLDKVTASWSPFPLPLAGHNYRAIRISQETLQGIDPFDLVAASGPKTEMGSHTLVVVGATFSDGQPGFVLLDDHADLMAGDRAAGEQLQDHTCAIAQK